MVRARRYVEALAALLKDARTPTGNHKNCCCLVGTRFGSAAARGEAPRVRDALYSSARTSTQGQSIKLLPAFELLSRPQHSSYMASIDEACGAGGIPLIDIGDLELDEEDESDPACLGESIWKIGYELNRKNMWPIFIGPPVTYHAFRAKYETPLVRYAHTDCPMPLDADKNAVCKGGSWYEGGDGHDAGTVYPELVHFSGHRDMVPPADGEWGRESMIAKLMQTNIVGKLQQFGVYSQTAEEVQFARMYPSAELYMASEMQMMKPDDVTTILMSGRDFRYADKFLSYLPDTKNPRFAKRWVSIDLSCLDPGVAPGVDRGEPGGMSVRSLYRAIDDCGWHLEGADICGVGTGDVTPRVAAKLVCSIVQHTAQFYGQIPLTVNEGVNQGMEWIW